MNQIKIINNCNFYIVVNGPPLQSSIQPSHLKQTSNYKKQKSNPLIPPKRNQYPNIQQTIYGSMPPISTCGQIPYVSHQQDPNYSDIPSFNLLKRGKGIDQTEYNVITHAANDALQAKEDPLSNGIIKRIKKSLGGEWFAFASVKELKGFDFSLSIVTGNDFLSFYIGKFQFQVCRLRD